MESIHGQLNRTLYESSSYDKWVKQFYLQDHNKWDVELRFYKSISDDTDTDGIKYFTIEVYDASKSNITRTVFPVLDLIGASILSSNDHLIEISVMPLDLRNACGCRTANPTKRNLYNFEYFAKSRINAINIVASL